MLQAIYIETKKLADPSKAKLLAGFFKTGKGEYGEGDIFYGLTVPVSRKIAKKYIALSLKENALLLASKIHEERLIALLILVEQYAKGDEKIKKEIYEYYLSNTKYINNWDLVDLSASRIVGMYLVANKKIKGDIILKKLAISENIWERRIAMLSTFPFIYEGNATMTFDIADILLLDKHDLIQKAVGWLLREVGKRISQQVEENYLKSRYKTMPRTALRYAIERFPEEQRKKYLHGLV